MLLRKILSLTCNLLIISSLLLNPLPSLAMDPDEDKESLFSPRVGPNNDDDEDESILSPRDKPHTKIGQIPPSEKRTLTGQQQTGEDFERIDIPAKTPRPGTDTSPGITDTDTSELKPNISLEESLLTARMGEPESILSPDEPAPKPSPKPKIPLTAEDFKFLDNLPSLVEDPKHPLRQNLNTLIGKIVQYPSNPLEYGEVLKSALILLYKYEPTTDQNRKNPARFFEKLDENIFIVPISKLTRVIQAGTAIFYAFVPIGLGSVALYLTGPLLGTERSPGVLPVDSNYTYTILATVGAFTLPVCLQEGWRRGQQLDKAMRTIVSKVLGSIRRTDIFDRYGFRGTPKTNTPLPHVQPLDQPILSRVQSALFATIRTLPLGFIFYLLQRPLAPTVWKGLGAPLTVSRWTQAYEDLMKASHHRKPTDGQKILLGSVKKIRGLINAAESDALNAEASDALVVSIYKPLYKGINLLKERIERKNTFIKNIEFFLLSHDSKKIPQVVFFYMAKELGNISFDQKLQKTLPADIMARITKNRPKKEGKPTRFDRNTIEPAICSIEEYIETNLRTMKLTHALEEKKILMRQLNTDLTKYLEDYFKADDNHVFFQNIYAYIKGNEEPQNQKGNKRTAYELEDPTHREGIINKIKEYINSYLAVSLSEKIHKYISNVIADAEENYNLPKALKGILQKTPHTKLEGILTNFIVNYISGKLTNTLEDLRSKVQNGQEKTMAEQAVPVMINQSLENLPLDSSLMLKIYAYLQRESGRVMLTDELGVPAEDTIQSLASLLFVKQNPILEFQQIKERLKAGRHTIAKAAQKAQLSKDKDKVFLPEEEDFLVDEDYYRRAKEAKIKELSKAAPPPDTENDTLLIDSSATELPTFKRSTDNDRGEYAQIPVQDAEDIQQGLQKIEDLEIDKMAMRIAAIDKKPHKSGLRKFLEDEALRFQGRAALAQELLTLYVTYQIFGLWGADDMAATAGGLGMAFIDHYTRAFQEKYIQQAAFASLVKKTYDYRPVRWFSTACAFVASGFYSLPILAVSFAGPTNSTAIYNETIMPNEVNVTSAPKPVLIENTPLWFKILVAGHAFPTEIGSLLHHHMEALKTIIRKTSELFMKRCNTVSQQRSVLNDYLDKLEEIIPELDEATTKQLLDYGLDMK